jgi:hypothetical protein
MVPTDLNPLFVRHYWPYLIAGAAGLAGVLCILSQYKRTRKMPEVQSTKETRAVSQRDKSDIDEDLHSRQLCTVSLHLMYSFRAYKALGLRSVWTHFLLIFVYCYYCSFYQEGRGKLPC